MGDDSGATVCFCIIPHRSKPAMLVRQDGYGYRCPSVVLPPNRLDYFPDHIPHIRHEIRDATGLDVTVLRHLRDLDRTQICVLEVHSVSDTVPDGYAWIDEGEASMPSWSDEGARTAWDAWTSPPLSEDKLAPWEQPGWFARAAEWMGEQLDAAGYKLAASVQQFKGAWDWSSILCADTDRGAVYLKADYRKPPKEAAVVQKLAERWQDSVPQVIAADIERNWMLTSDFGRETLDLLPPDRYPPAVAQYAAIQRSALDELDDWQRLGCLDMTAGRLMPMLRRLLADAPVLRDSPNALSPEEMDDVQAAIPGLEEMCVELASSSLPNTISNEDFRAGNIVVRGDGYLFYDWSNTVITHPMFGINYFLGRIHRPSGVDRLQWRYALDDAPRRAIVNAYLSEWSEYASREQLKREFWLCRRLYYLYDALRCHGDLPFVRATSPWAMATVRYIPQAVRQLLTGLDYA
jgi:hypothetical protein